MQWIAAHSQLISEILGLLLVVSESIATITQILFPSNQGVSGILAFIVKVIQSLQANISAPASTSTGSKS